MLFEFIMHRREERKRELQADVTEIQCGILNIATLNLTLIEGMFRPPFTKPSTLQYNAFDK